MSSVHHAIPAISTFLRKNLNNTHGAVLLHLLEVAVDRLQTVGTLPPEGGLRESLLLRGVPVGVEATASIVGQMLGKDRLQGTKTSRSFDVANHSDQGHRRCLDDGHSLNDFLLVDLCSVEREPRKESTWLASRRAGGTAQKILAVPRFLSPIIRNHGVGHP